jgi:isopenicillin N synthase-like dioxygenase
LLKVMLIFYIIDFGSVTLLWSQPVSALQLLQPDGTWKWVKHIPDALVRDPDVNMEEYLILVLRLSTPAI